MWVAIGGVLRFWNLDVMEFKGDEREALNLARDLLSRAPFTAGWPPAHGMISSNYVHNAPLFTWIIALFWLMVPNPEFVASCIAALNTACLVPLWTWARRTLDDRRALLIVAAAAASPFAVLFSRKIWAQDLLFPALVTLLWAVYWLRNGRLWIGIALGGVGGLAVGQLHQSGMIALPLLAVVVCVQLLRDHRRGQRVLEPGASRLAIAAAIVVVLINAFFWFPYLRYLLTLSSQSVLQARPVEDSYAPVLLTKLVLQLVPVDLQSFFLFDRGEFQSTFLRWGVFRLSWLLGLPVCAYGVWRWLSAPGRIAVFGYWWWVVVGAFAVLRIKTQFFYTLILAPLPYVLVGGGFDPPRHRLSGWLHAVRWIYVCNLALLAAVTIGWLSDRGGAAGDYGVSYRVRKQQAEAIVAAASGATLADHAPLPAALRCGEPGPDVMWLVEWLDPRAVPGAAALSLCDDWTPVDDDLRYQWRLQKSAGPRR